MKKKSSILLKRLVAEQRNSGVRKLFGGDIVLTGEDIINQNQYDPDLSALNLTTSDLIIYINKFIDMDLFEITSQGVERLTLDNFESTDLRVTSLAEDHLYVISKDSQRIKWSFNFSVVAFILSLAKPVTQIFQWFISLF